VLIAGLLLTTESLASDAAEADGFLSKQSSMSAYDKFITPNFNRAKHALSYQKNAAEHDPFTIVDDKEEAQAAQKLLPNGNSTPMTLYAAGVGLFALAMMLTVRIWRGLQPASALASNGALVSDMSKMMVPGLWIEWKLRSNRVSDGLAWDPVNLRTSNPTFGWQPAVFAVGHAVIVQNKGGGHGEIGFHLAKTLAEDKDLTVTIVQDAAAKKEALPFSKYGELPSTVSVEWVDTSDAGAVEAACGDKATHVFDNNSKKPGDAAPIIAAAKKSDAFYSFVSSAGMYTAKGMLQEENPVKDPPTGQREVELTLEKEFPGRWTAFRPQYIYGPYTNKRDYLDWFLKRAARDIQMAVPADAQQPVSITHCEDVASLISSVVGKESEAGGEIFNCGTDKMCSYDDVCNAAAKALGKEASVAALPPDTKTSFPFRPNAEGFAVRVKKVMEKTGWAGAKHNVLEDISKDGFYTKDFLALGLDKGDLDTSKDGLELCQNLK